MQASIHQTFSKGSSVSSCSRLGDYSTLCTHSCVGWVLPNPGVRKMNRRAAESKAHDSGKASGQGLGLGWC